MTNAELSRRLTDLAALSEIDGDNPFRVRAYRNAARTVLELEEQVTDLLERGADLTSYKGIGKEIAEKLHAMVTTGRLPSLDALAERVPYGLIGVTEVQGVGPKKAASLWRELGVTSVDDLERAASLGRVAGLEGFGAKTQEKILNGIEAYRRHVGRTRLGDADAIVEPLVRRLRAVDGVTRLEVAGSYRRRKETIGDIDLLAVADDPGALSRTLRETDEVEEVLGSGESKTSVRLARGLQVDLRIVDESSYGAALLYFTGSKEHNVALRQRAVDRGWRLNEYGLFDGDDDDGRDDGGAGQGRARLAGGDEAGVYGAFGLDWIPPELREERGELEAAERHALPELLTLADIRGDLHMHSDWSDGKASVRQMMAACEERGYAYMALTDHSQALRMTGGLDAEKLGRQWAALDELLDGRDGLELLRGLEVDVLKDGGLDLDDAWLARLDVVIVSVHSHFGLSQAEQTERVVRAVSHPRVNLLGHPTGRLLGERDPFAIDLDAVFAACAENDVAVELNASPERLDLRDSHLMAARRHGLTVAIDTDAHRVRHLDNMRFGVDQARRAWLEPGAVLNTRSLAEVRRFLAKGAG